MLITLSHIDFLVKMFLVKDKSFKTRQLFWQYLFYFCYFSLDQVNTKSPGYWKMGWRGWLLMWYTICSFFDTVALISNVEFPHVNCEDKLFGWVARMTFSRLVAVLRWFKGEYHCKWWRMSKDRFGIPSNIGEWRCFFGDLQQMFCL